MTAKGIPSLGSAGARWASGPCSGGPAERPELRREGAEPAGSGSSALARLCKKRTREGRAEAAELQNALHRPGLLLAASVCPACRELPPALPALLPTPLSYFSGYSTWWDSAPRSKKKMETWRKSLSL